VLRLDVVERSVDAKGFVPPPRGRLLERTFS
jgi:hypothetical protein